jgi:hypothetical protein
MTKNSDHGLGEKFANSWQNICMTAAPKFKENFIHIYESTLELANLLKAEPSLLEKKLLTKGNEILAIYNDGSFKNSFSNLRQMKMETYKMIVEDLAMGAMTLRKSVVGLTFKENRIQTFICAYGTNPSGNMMFSVSLRNIAAFKNWREGDADPLPEEDIQACIYTIAAAIAELL